MKNVYLILIAAIGISVHYVDSCRNKPPLPIVQIKIVNDTMTYFFDKDSLRHSRLAQEIDNRDHIIAKYGKQIKEQAKRLKIKDNQIVEMQNEIVEIKGQFQAGLQDIFI